MREEEIEKIIAGAKSRKNVNALNWHNLEFAQRDRLALLKVVEYLQTEIKNKDYYIDSVSAAGRL